MLRNYINFWSKYPFTETHVLNLDWFLKELVKLKENFSETIDEIVETVEGLGTTKQDKLTAGANINISSSNVISATVSTPTWNGVTGKPFSTIGSGLSVVGDALTATGGGGGGVTINTTSVSVAQSDWIQFNDIYLATKTINLNYDDLCVISQRFNTSAEFYVLPAYTTVDGTTITPLVSAILSKDSNGKIGVTIMSADDSAGTFTIDYLNRGA